MRRAVRVSALIVVIGLLAGLVWWLTGRNSAPEEIVLYGNVDLRQVQLSFNNSERIADVLVQEGERVRKGQVLARLDTRRLEPQVAQAEAQAAAQRQVVQRLRSGSRPEEIAQARANVDSAKADAVNARQQYERIKSAAEISAGRAVRQQDVDSAKAALQVAEAKLVVNQRALELAVIGPRKEDIAEAEARLRANEAQLALLRQQLVDAQLLAPMDAVVRTRVLEPGDMASPQRPVFSLAITDPKWVRAYVPEPNLGKLHEGMTAAVAVDSFPERRFKGWVGFISPVAEFTPKTVQTEELRTSLVYELRVFVKDPSDELRLGMPATVYLNTDKETGKQGDKETGKQGNQYRQGDAETRRRADQETRRRADQETRRGETRRQETGR
jgi:HlyD family secretion protein